MVNYIRAAFGLLLAIGLFAVLYGLVGPVSTGSVFAEVVVEELDLPKEPNTYTKLAELYADSAMRKGYALAFLGVLIVLPALFGLWATAGRDFLTHPASARDNND